MKLIRQNLTRTDTFLDIGANIGQHGLYASNFCKDVYSFEPIERLYNQLLLSIEKNQFQNVRAFNIGLGDESKEVAIYSDTSNMGGSSVLFNKGKYKEQIIKIRKLDDFLPNSVTQVNMMKIDVEGFEWEVLVGAEKVLEKYRPKILLEYSLPLYNQISKSRGEDIYNILSKNYQEIYNVGLDLEIKKRISSYSDLKDLTHHTNLWCTN